jgi:hypothetical protein
VYTIVAFSDVKPNSVITNKADVFFDYGTIASTNTVFHTLKKDFLITSIYDPENDKGRTKLLKIYPNPTNGEIIIEREKTSESEELYLYNLAGELFERRVLTQNEEKIRLIHIEKPGLYYLIIKRGDTLCYYGSITILK